MQFNVVKNAKKNLSFGIVNRFILLVCPFIERIVINNVLGAQYLGLGSLFVSVLNVLALSELGFSTAMVYNMFKPAGEKDTVRMNALLNYYKRVYRMIGSIILAVGLVLIPFLPRLIKDSYPQDINLTYLYLIYLSNTAVSYFLFAYRESLLVVHQRDDVRSFIHSIVKIVMTGLQIAALFLTKNYYYFALLMLLATVINNLWVNFRVRALYPQYQPRGKLSDDDRAEIRKLVSGTFIQQACTVTRNSLDSIFISAYLGLTMTGIYNNYYLILNGVTTFTGLVTAAFTGGVGNHVAMRDPEQNYQEMKRLDFVYLWLGGWCAISMLCLYQPFVTLWMGKDMLLPDSAALLMCLYFYLLKLGDMRFMYTTATGLWWEQRYRAIGETAVNVILNIILGKYFGVHGIILATMLSLFACNYLWASHITFRLYFTLKRLWDYYRYQAVESAFVFAAAAVTWLICVKLPVHDALPAFLLRAVVCVIVPNALFVLVYHRTAMFKYALNAIRRRK